MEFKILLSQFQALQYNQRSVFTRQLIDTEINKIIQKQKNPNYNSLDSHVANQIWDQTSQGQSQVQLVDYINTLIQAKKLLEDRLSELQRKLNQRNSEKQRILQQASKISNTSKQQQMNNYIKQIDEQIQQLNHDLYDFSGDYNNLQVLFGQRQSVSKSNIKVNTSNNRNSIDPMNLNESRKSGYQPLRNSGGNAQNSNRHSQIFFKRSDKTLMTLFVLTLIYLILELLLMNHKYHFLNLLFGIGLLTIFALNYFDKLHIKFLMILDGLSFVLDLVWLIIKAGPFWKQNTNSVDSNLNRGFLRFIVFFVAIIMIIKIIIFGILWSYQNVQQRTSITVCGYDINLTGEQGISPVSKILSSKNQVQPV